MSRGHGKLQRAILDFLNSQDAAIDTFTVTAAAYGYEPDADGRITLKEAHVVSVRRALGKLAKEGLIFDLGRHWQGGRRRWAGERYGLRYKIRVMQHENAIDAATGNGDAVRERAQVMVPLIERAHALGIKEF